MIIQLFDGDKFVQKDFSTFDQFKRKQKISEVNSEQELLKLIDQGKRIYSHLSYYEDDYGNIDEEKTSLFWNKDSKIVEKHFWDSKDEF